MKGNVHKIYELGKRDNQEDCLYPNVNNGVNMLRYFILCDGIGGHSKGELASSTVCSVLSEWLDSNVIGRAITKEDFKTALHAAYDKLDAIDTSDSIKKMGTTLTFVTFTESGVLAAHIGDSRIYHIRPSADAPILYKSIDHSLVNDLFKIGEITEEEMATSKSRHILTRAVQSHQEYRSEAEIHLLTDVREGDYFYLCSDGMLENISDKELVEIFKLPIPDEDKTQLLLENSADNKDNHSAFIIRILEEGNPKPFTSNPLPVKPVPTRSVPMMNSKGRALKGLPNTSGGKSSFLRKNFLYILVFLLSIVCGIFLFMMGKYDWLGWILSGKE